MKKILSIFISLLLISAGAWAEGATPSPAPTQTEDAAGAVYDLYDFNGETMDVSAPYWIAFDGLFKMQIPAHWKNYALSDAQSENGMIACFGDGTHFMFVGRAEDTGAYADMNALGVSLTLNDNYASIFLNTFGETEFVCYSDYENNASDCAILIPGKGVYTFYFYPMDGNTDFAQTVLDLMNSYTTLEVVNGNE